MHRIERNEVIVHLCAALHARHGVPSERVLGDLKAIAELHPEEPEEPAIQFLCGQLLVRPQSRA
jgi:hypothetical protein